MKEKNKFDDQVEGRNSVIELLESGRDVNKIFIIKTLGKISAVWYNRRYINEFGKAGLINESCCYGYR